MFKEKKSEKAEQPQEQKTEYEKLLEEVARKKLETLSLESTQKAISTVNDPDLSIEVGKILDEAINGAFDIGRAAGMKKEDLQKMTDSLKETLSQFLNPLFVERVEKYKHLYCYQRMVTSELISALRHFEIIGNIHETNCDLMTASKEKGSPALDTTLAGLGAAFVPILEKAIKE